MPEIYAQFVSKKTGIMHRLCFDLKIGIERGNSIRRETFRKNGVVIDDPAIHLFKGKKGVKASNPYCIYVDSSTPVQVIIETLKEYMETYYQPNNNTLMVDIEP